MLCLLTTTIRDSLTKCSNYAEENPAILSKNYGNGSSKYVVVARNGRGQR